MRQHVAIRRRNSRLTLLKCVAASLIAFAFTAVSIAQYPQTQWPDTTPKPVVQASHETLVPPQTGTPTPATPQQNPAAAGTMQFPPANTNQTQQSTVWPQTPPAATNAAPAPATTPIQPMFQPAIQPAAAPPAGASSPMLFSAAGDVAPPPTEAPTTEEAAIEAAVAEATEGLEPGSPEWREAKKDATEETKLWWKAEQAKHRFRNALRGDRQAQQEIFTEYILPAVMALLVLMVGYMIASYFGRITGETVSKRVDLTLGKFSGRLVRNTIMLVTVLGVLGYFGVPVAGIATIFAAASFAVGMALQGTLGNFAAGIMLLVFRPFKIGDYIKVAGIEGAVEEIDLFTTKLDTLDNRRLIVPNGEVFGSVIENCTRNEIRRVDVNVGVAYNADMRVTRQVLADAIAVIPGAVTQPEPDVYLDSLGASSVDWQLRVWCRPENYWDVRQRVTMAAKDALDAADIGIPFPQLDLHVVSGMIAAEQAVPSDVSKAA